jgi:methylated-DNA-[protein]-cysteine S-methyltransferase
MDETTDIVETLPMASLTTNPIVTHDHATRLGIVRLAAQGDMLVGVWFADQAALPFWAHQATPCSRPPSVLAQATGQIDAYCDGQRTAFDLPIGLVSGTPFQRMVWEALRAIPYGSTTTYRHIAAAVGRPLAVRATGAAIGRNPLCLVIPCHRVIGANGQLTGYAGGVSRKRELLAHEAG